MCIRILLKYKELNKKIILFFSLFAFMNPIFAVNTIHILGWSGYLISTPEIAKATKQVETKCNVNISYDNYDSYDQMLEFLETKNNYDIAILSDTFLRGIKKYIVNNNSDSYKLRAGYNPTLKKHISLSNYPNNVTIFQIALTGVIYNPKNVKLDKNFDLKEAFNIATKYIVVFLDDPYETAVMMQKSYFPDESQKMTYKKIIRNLNLFEQKAKGKRIYFSTGYEPRDLSSDFALQMIWVGDGLIIQKIAKNTAGENLKYIIPEKFNYVTSDILVNFNNKQSTMCVMKMLSSKEYIRKLDLDIFYFSPFLTASKLVMTKSKKYNQLEIAFLNVLDKSNNETWLDAMDFTNHQKVYNLWQKIRGEISYNRSIKNY